MTKKVHLCEKCDMFLPEAGGDCTDIVVCEAISPHPVLYTRAVWMRWNGWMRRQAGVFVREWAHGNPLLLAMLMRSPEKLARWDVRRIRTPHRLTQRQCADPDARWCVSLEGAKVKTEKRMIDRLADELDRMTDGNGELVRSEAALLTGGAYEQTL